MRIRSKHKDTIAEIYIGKRGLQAVKTELEALRSRCGQSSDLLTTTQVVLADTARWNTFPVTVLMRRRKDIYGAVLLHGHMKYGLPTGMLQAGHLCGRGAVIAMEAERNIVAEIAAQALLRSILAHTVVIRLTFRGVYGDVLSDVSAREVDGRWLLRDKPCCMNLESGLEALMSRFSYKMRRNLRYYRRRAEQDLGCIFVPQLSPAASRQAVEALNSNSSYPIRTACALRYDAALSTTPGSFAMGLRDRSGNWLSYLAGWRQAGTVYVEWQLNSSEHADASLSAVMRSYCLEHEITLGGRQLIFVGGTTPAWGRACERQVCGDLIVIRKGVIGFMARLLSRWLSPRGQIAELHKRAEISPTLQGVA